MCFDWEGPAASMTRSHQRQLPPAAKAIDLISHPGAVLSIQQLGNPITDLDA
jgi:hypothetical protein